jgi:hypothetical protein
LFAFESEYRQHTEGRRNVSEIALTCWLIIRPDADTTAPAAAAATATNTATATTTTTTHIIIIILNMYVNRY